MTSKGKTAYEILTEMGVPEEAITKMPEPEVVYGKPKEIYEQMRLEHMNYHRFGMGHCHGCRLLEVIRAFAEKLGDDA